MAGEERKVADARGEVLHAIEGGWERSDATWTMARIVVTTEQIRLLTEDGERERIALEDVDEFPDRVDVSDAARRTSRYLAVRAGEDVTLLRPTDASDERDLLVAIARASMRGAWAAVATPRIDGGYVARPSWTRARVSVDGDAVEVVTAGGDQFSIPFNDVAYCRETTATVGDDERAVLTVEHERDGRSVETALALDATPARMLEALLREGIADHARVPEVGIRQQRVLAGIYAGLAPDQIARAAGIHPDVVAERLTELLELGLVTPDAERTLAPTVSGRRLVQDAYGTRLPP